jgi:hypothetical protein
MASIKIETEDVMPVVVTVLNYMSTDLTTCMFKIALDNQLSDLKGLVDPEYMDQSMTDLASKLDDPLSLIINEFTGDLMLLYARLAMVHAIDLEETFCDERLTDLAGDLYGCRHFYTDGMTERNRADLEVFIYSLPVVVDQLIDLIQTEEYEPEELKLWVDMLGAHFDRFANSEVPAIRELGALGSSIWEFQDKVFNAPDKHLP